MKGKSKKWLVIIILFAAVLILIIAARVYMIGKAISTGRCAVSENGGALWISDTMGPIVMNGDNILGTSFEDLETGDKIWLIHANAIAESYPGQVTVYVCLRIGKGSVEDIPQNTLEELQGLGWKI